jgi:acetylglutamate synthase
MKKLILFSLLALMSCKKEDKEKVTTSTLQVTGYGLYATIDINGQIYYPPLITYTVKTKDIVKFKDSPSGSDYRNIVLTIDNNVKYTYSGYGVAQTTLIIE